MALPGAQRFELDNGLPVYLVESHGLPLTVASLVSRWGSAADPAERPGLAGFTADMLDEGTQTRDALGIAREIESLGASLSTGAGGDGSSVSVAALSPQLSQAMAVMSDVVRAPAFPPAEIDRVRGESLVALQQQGDDPTAIASTVTSRELYGPGHPYGHTAGEVGAGLTATTREDLQRFHQSAFTPRTCALILAGDLTAEQARALATEHFGSWRGTGTDPRPPGPPVPRAGAGVRRRPTRLRRRPRWSSPSPGSASPIPTPPQLTVMNAVLGGGFTSRLYPQPARAPRLHLRRILLRGPRPRRRADHAADEREHRVHRRLDPRDAQRGRRAPGRAGQRRGTAHAPRTPSASRCPPTSPPAPAPPQPSASCTCANLPPDYYQNLPAATRQIDAEDVQAVARAHLRPEEMKVVAVGDPGADRPPAHRAGARTGRLPEPGRNAPRDGVSATNRPHFPHSSHPTTGCLDGGGTPPRCAAMTSVRSDRGPPHPVDEKVGKTAEEFPARG